MFDPTTLRVVYVNRGGADLIGLEADALLGSSVLQLQPAHEADGFRARLATLRSGPTASTVFTGVLIRSDGREIPVEAFLQEVVAARCPPDGDPDGPRRQRPDRCTGEADPDRRATSDGRRPSCAP